MTKFDLLPASEQEELKQNIFFYHPESYALYDNGEFCPDVSPQPKLLLGMIVLLTPPVH